MASCIISAAPDTAEPEFVESANAAASDFRYQIFAVMCLLAHCQHHIV